MALHPRVAEVLAHPRFAWAAALVGVLLAWPALSQGLLLDDHLHRLYVDAVARGEAPGAWWELYTVAAGDPEANREAMELGATPWWTLPELRLRFLRPLAALTHHLDHRLWPEAAWLAHLHSLAWYAALVVATAALLRRWLGASWVAGLGTLLFAVDDAHGTPIAWIAQRNALISALLVVLCLLAHDRWRREGWRAGAWWGPLSLLAGLLAGEMAVAALGYLFAHAWLLDPHIGAAEGRSLGARARACAAALGPYLVVIVGWRLLYDALGYGAFGSAVYLDPVRELGPWLAALPDRFAASLLGQLAWPAAQSWIGVAPPWTNARWGAAAVVMVLVICLAPVLRRERGAAVCGVGALLAVLPVTTSVPDDRLLLLVGVGASGVVAAVIGVALGWAEASRARRIPAMLVTPLLLALHLVAAAVQRPGDIAALPGRLEQSQRASAAGIPDDPALAEQTLVVVNAPPTLVGATLWLVRASEGGALPARLRVLGSTFAPVIVQRPDARTLVLQPVGGYLGDPFTTIVRGPGHPLRPGDRVLLPGLEVEVQGVAESRPTVVRMRFEVPLEDPSLRWITWKGDRFGDFAPPPVGRAAVSPGVAPGP